MRHQSISKDIVQNFILGGFIVASVSYVGTFMGPLLGAIWWSFPLSLLPSIYFMHQQTKNNAYIAEFVLSTAYALSLLFVTTYALSYFIKNNTENDIIFPILKAVILWIVLSAIFYFVVKYFNLAKFFI